MIDDTSFNGVPFTFSERNVQRNVGCRTILGYRHFQRGCSIFLYCPLVVVNLGCHHSFLKFAGNLRGDLIRMNQTSSKMCKLPVFFKADEPERKGHNALDFQCSLEVRKRNTLIIVASIANNQRVLCGKSGIRTRERLSAVTDFPGLPLQPLEHLSLFPILLLAFGTRFPGVPLQPLEHHSVDFSLQS